MLLIDSARLVYRGPRPTLADLQSNGIRSVVDLEPSGKGNDELRRAGIVVFEIPMSSFARPRLDDVQLAVRWLLKLAPRVMVHCRRGRSRSGVVCAAFRTWISGFTIEQAIQEMKELRFEIFKYWWWMPRIKRIIGTPSPFTAGA